MKFLHDPLKLANTVLDTLKGGDVEHALALVRASQTALDGAPIPAIVSWNHIMDWLMMKGNHGAAWKVYNEVRAC
jgi:pentatricopeptide repeat protein